MTRLLWLDLETTGLSPHQDRILEVACGVADLASPFDLRGGYLWSYPIQLEYPCPSPHSKVLEMHTLNGLWEESFKSSWTLQSVERIILENVLELGPLDSELRIRTNPPDVDVILAGHSVHFDLRFLQNWMPKLARFVHNHKVYDVSAVKLFCESLGMPKLPKGDPVHRAEPDVRHAIAQAQECVGWINAHGHHHG